MAELRFLYSEVSVAFKNRINIINNKKEYYEKNIVFEIIYGRSCISFAAVIVCNHRIRRRSEHYH